MRQSERAIEALGAVVLVVSFGPAAELRERQETLRLPWPCLVDEERAVYAAYGLGRATFAHALRPRVVLLYLRALLRGHRPQRPIGDPLQLGGDFVVGPDGRLLLAYPQADPVDRPAVAELLAVLRRAAEAGHGAAGAGRMGEGGAAPSAGPRGRADGCG